MARSVPSAQRDSHPAGECLFQCPGLIPDRLEALVLAVGGLVGIFLFGWKRRKDKPPPGVKPLPPDDDDWR